MKYTLYILYIWDFCKHSEGKLDEKAQSSAIRSQHFLQLSNKSKLLDSMLFLWSVSPTIQSKSGRPARLLAQLLCDLVWVLIVPGGTIRLNFSTIIVATTKKEEKENDILADICHQVVFMAKAKPNLILAYHKTFEKD